MVKHEYTCNLCKDSGDSASLVGLHWTYIGDERRDGAVAWPVHQAETHLCLKCRDDIYRMATKSYRAQSEEMEPGDTKRAMVVVARMIRDAARKAVDSKTAVDSEEFDRLIGLFNLPDHEMFARVLREVETAKQR